MISITNDFDKTLTTFVNLRTIDEVLYINNKLVLLKLTYFTDNES